MLDALVRADDCAELTSRARKTLSQLGRALSEINKLASTESPDRIIEEIMRCFDYGDYLDDGTERGLGKAAGLVDGVIELREGVGVLMPADDQLEAVREARIRSRSKSVV